MKPVNRLFVLTWLLCSAQGAHADLFLGLEAGVSVWNAAPEGQVGQTSAYLGELGFDEENYNSFYMGVELIGLPDIRLSRTRIDSRGRGTISRAFNLDSI